MDLKAYYQKIRDAAAKIGDRDVVIVSLETPDGGKGGVKTEVPAAIAAKMLVDGVAELASPEDTTAFRLAQAEAKQKADDEAAAAKVAFSLIPAAELSRLRQE